MRRPFSFSALTRMRIRRRPLLYALLLGALASPFASAKAIEPLPGVPAAIDPTQHYLIYLHGRIFEGRNAKASDPRFGSYEFEAIVHALAAQGAVVIAEHRPMDTDIGEYATHVAAQVRQLLAAGVPATNIGVVGFSKGGYIAVLTAARLHDPAINYVFLASCGETLFQREDVDVAGRMLSIRESTDSLGRSCEPLFEAASTPGEYEEIEIHTGHAHGAFYRPNPQWVHPSLRWLRLAQ